jgi:transcriptional regulator with XRE-family HTH domain
MAITHERLGFFNARLEQRMSEVGLSTKELARRVGVSYEHVRKLLIGQCLPSDYTLEKLCAALELDMKEMSRRVLKDKMIFRCGDAVWIAWGRNPRWAPFYILVPLLSPKKWSFMLTCMRAVAEARTQAGCVQNDQMSHPQGSNRG